MKKGIKILLWLTYFLTGIYVGYLLYKCTEKEISCETFLIILSVLLAITFACFIWALHKIIKLAGMIKILTKK